MSAVQRLLIVRTDRLGEVVLSLPAVMALRAAYPSASIAMMVRPPCHELLEGHPAVNEVLVYEKDGAHRGIFATIAFAWRLRRARFDTALILHPTHRSHWIAALAGIPTRIGWNRKGGGLLTQRLVHTKQEGRAHELDYTLEFLDALHIPAAGRLPTMACLPRAQERVAGWLSSSGVRAEETLVVCHPSASGPEKRWPAESFAALADRLIRDARARVILTASADGAADCEAVARAMRRRPLISAGLFDLQELAALLRRAQLLISNDSGPVHVAVSQGTPVIALFGRTQPGVNPERWKPLGPRDLVLCREPLSALSPEEVFRSAAPLLRSPG